MAEIIDVVTRINYDVDDAALKTSTGELLKQLATVQSLQDEINALEKEQAILGKNEVKRQAEITAAIDRHKLAIDETTQSILKQIQADEKLAAAINKGTLELKRQQEVTQNAASAVTRFTQAQGRAASAQQAFSRNSSAANNAAFALSQTLREAPAFAFSFQTGLLGISNNLPILVDQFKNLAAQTQSSGQALAILGRSIFSATNLLTIGISVLTIFGGEIFKVGEESQDTAKDIDGLADSIDNLIRKQAQAARTRGAFSDFGTLQAEKQLELLKAQGASQAQIAAQERKVADFRKRDIQNQIDAYETLREVTNRTYQFLTNPQDLAASSRERVTLTKEEARARFQADREIIESLKQVTGQTTAEVQKQAGLIFDTWGSEDSPLGGFLVRLKELRNEQKLIDKDLEIDRARNARGNKIKKISEDAKEANVEIKILERTLKQIIDSIQESQNRQPVFRQLDDAFLQRMLNAQNGGAQKEIDYINLVRDAYNSLASSLQSVIQLYEMQDRILAIQFEAQQTRVQNAAILAEKGNTAAYESEKRRLDEIQRERERVAQRQIQINALIGASNAALALTEATKGVLAAGATTAAEGGGVVGYIAGIAAAFAAVVALYSSIKQLSAFKDGVVDFQGKGTGTSDSNLVRISRGESVITADATRKYRPVLEAMNNGTFRNSNSMRVEGLEKRLDDVIYVLENQSFEAVNKLDRDGVSQMFTKYSRKQRNLRR